eukprot:g42.t1
MKLAHLFLALVVALGSAKRFRRPLSMVHKFEHRYLATPTAACSGKAEGDSCTFEKMDGSSMTSTCQSGQCGGGPPSASLLGDVGLTTVAGTDVRTGKTLAVGENIYGPFEAGFSDTQNGILEGLGCSSGTLGHVDGGIDTHMAEQMVAYQCNVVLPRVEGSEYISLLDECGGHTNEYHFHERLSCLYEETGGHSPRIGTALDGKGIYGKWEDYATSTLPLLDACGGSFGVTPDSNGEEVYHYHVQDSAPFTIGCFGPMADSNGDQTLVTLAACRAAYPDDCGNGDTKTYTSTAGALQYDPWCPCFDGAGSNVGTAELAAFSASNTATTTLTGVKLMDVPADLTNGENGAPATATSSLLLAWAACAAAAALAF